MEAPRSRDDLGPGDWLATPVEERMGAMTLQQDAEQQHPRGAENRAPRDGVWAVRRRCGTEQDFVVGVDGTIHHTYERHPGTT